MNGALVVLAVNVAVALLFAASYAIIAFAGRGQRAALWFSGGYLIGMLSPTADFLVPIVGWAAPLEWLSYISFLLATVAMSVTLCLFHGRRPPWRAVAGIVAIGMVCRCAIWDLPRGTFLYAAAYQLAYFLAALLAVRTVLQINRRPLALLLAGTLALLAVNFATKPLIAVALGQGRRMQDYTSTTYALLSQASTGILLLAAGLVLLILVALEAIARSERESETDPLSGLLNRRGFDRNAQAVLARALAHGRPVAAAVFDLDHFKRINDAHGHAEGDAVIARFAALLRDRLPRGAVIGRMGGEEFAALLDGADLAVAERMAEALRRANAERLGGDAPWTTISGGVAQAGDGEPLSDLLRRADQAAYQAKSAGRDRICAALTPPATPSAPRLRAA